MRKQYDGLYALVVAELKADPLSGDRFLFTNRHRTRAKVRLWGRHRTVPLPEADRARSVRVAVASRPRRIVRDDAQ
jgi:hypothetical protein